MLFIGYYTFAAMPYILMAILMALVVLSLLDTLHKHNKKMTIVLTISNLICLALLIGIYAVSNQQLIVYFRTMPKVLGIYFVLFIIVYLIFYFPKSKYKNKVVSTVLCVVLCVATLIGFSGLDNFKINSFEEGAVVYAVEDNYQIVFTTACKGTGFVTIGDTTYYDTEAGNLVHSETVHKVTVPQDVLDENKSYTIGSKSILLEEAFSAITGRTITKEFTFRPIDETDGIQYYTVADAHDNFSGVIDAANYYGDETDFVVVAGDNVNYLESTDSLERVLHLNYEVSKGEIPVVYARGNHELNGEASGELYRYVGTNENDEYYFTFNLGESVWGIVLDMGQNYNDDWYEYYGVANSEEYRYEQIDFVKDVIADKENTYDADGIEHRIAISHINTAITDYEQKLFYDYFVELNTSLNQIPLDIMLSGHVHEVFYVQNDYAVGDELTLVNTDYIGGESSGIPEYVATGANYNSLVCSRHSDIQSLSVDNNFIDGSYLGVALEYNINDEVLEVRFTNSKNEVVEALNPFEQESYGDVIYLS
jgi:hypothetical protein